jgi:hypothetical protein
MKGSSLEHAPGSRAAVGRFEPSMGEGTLRTVTVGAIGFSWEQPQLTGGVAKPTLISTVDTASSHVR